MSMNALVPNSTSGFFNPQVPCLTDLHPNIKPPLFPNGSAKINNFIFYVQGFFEYILLYTLNIR
jgi:hypothetical protein